MEDGQVETHASISPLGDEGPTNSGGVLEGSTAETSKKQRAAKRKRRRHRNADDGDSSSIISGSTLQSQLDDLDALNDELSQFGGVPDLVSFLQNRPPIEVLQQLNILRDGAADAERRRLAQTHISAHLLNRPSAAQLAASNVMPSIGIARGVLDPVSQPDPTIRAAGRDLLWQLQRDHLSRSLRNKPTLDELVRRNIIRLGSESDGGPAYEYYQQRLHQGAYEAASDAGSSANSESPRLSAASASFMPSAGGGLSSASSLSSTVRHNAPMLASFIERRPQPEALLLSRPNLIQSVMMWTRLSIPTAAAKPPTLLGGLRGVAGMQAAAGIAAGAAAPPTPRNCHTLNLVGRRVFLCGGYEEGQSSGGGGNTASSSSSLTGSLGGAGSPGSGSLPDSLQASDGPAPLEPLMLDLDHSAWVRPPVGCARFDSGSGSFLPGPAGRYAHSAVPYEDTFLIVFGGFTSGKAATLAAAGGSVPADSPAHVTATGGGATWLNDVWILDTRSMPQAAALIASGFMDARTGTISPRPGSTGHALPPEFLRGDSYATDSASALGAMIGPSPTGRTGSGDDAALQVLTSSAAAAVATMAMGQVSMMNFYAAPTVVVAAATQSSSSPSQKAGKKAKAAAAAAAISAPTAVGSTDGPAPRCAHTSVVLCDRLMVVFGGNDGRGLFQDTWVLDLAPEVAVAAAAKRAAAKPASGAKLAPPQLEWSRAVTHGTPPSPRSGHTAVAYGSHTMILFGGGEGWGQQTFNDLYLLVAHTRPQSPQVGSGSGSGAPRTPLPSFTWLRPSFTGSPPAPRMGHSAVMLGDRMLVFAGGDSARAFNDLHVLTVHAPPGSDSAPGAGGHSLTMTWSRPTDSGALPSPRWGHVAAGIGTSHLVVYGGSSREGRNTGDLHALDTQFDYLGLAGSAATVATGTIAATTVATGGDVEAAPPPPKPSVAATVHLLQARQTAVAPGGRRSPSSVVQLPTARPAPTPRAPSGVKLPDGGAVVNESDEEDEEAEDGGEGSHGGIAGDQDGPSPPESLRAPPAADGQRPAISPLPVPPPAARRRHTVDGSVASLLPVQKVGSSTSSNIANRGGDSVEAPINLPPGPVSASVAAQLSPGHPRPTTGSAAAASCDLTVTRRRFSWSNTGSDTGMLAAALSSPPRRTMGSGAGTSSAAGAVAGNGRPLSWPRDATTAANAATGEVVHTPSIAPRVTPITPAPAIPAPASTEGSTASKLEALRARIQVQREEDDRHLEAVTLQLAQWKARRDAQYDSLLTALGELRL